MSTNDTCVTIQPYFKVKDGELDRVRPYLEQFVELTKAEKNCLYYGFSINGNKVHCREGYADADADAALAHLDNVGGLLQYVLGSGIMELTDLQLHGPQAELARLREPTAALNPSFWALEYGFRN